MAQLSEAGLLINSFDSIMARLISNTQDIFEQYVPAGDAVDTSSSTVLGRLLTLIAPYYLEAESCLLDIYNSMGVDTASGAQLERLLKLVDFTFSRLPYTLAQPQLTVSTAVNTILPAGSIVGSVDAESFYTLDDEVNASTPIVGLEFTMETNGVADTKTLTLTFPSDTVTFSVPYDGHKTRLEELNEFFAVVSHPLITAEIKNNMIVIKSSSTFTYTQNNLSIRGELKHVQATAKTNGSLAQKEGEISVVQTPVLGWNWVTNESPVGASEGIESDADMRIRFDTTRMRASRSMQAFYSRLYAVDGVKSVVVRSGPILLEGDTVPAAAFVVVVKGGSDVDVATAIWKETPFGITSYGNTSVVITDPYAGTVTVDFYRPVLVPVKVKIVVNVYEGHPTNVDDVIKAAVKDKIDSLAVGENLTIGKLFVALDGIKGIAVGSIGVAKVADAAYGNIVDLLYYESASVSLSDITVV